MLRAPGGDCRRSRVRWGPRQPSGLNPAPTFRDTPSSFLHDPARSLTASRPARLAPLPTAPRPPSPGSPSLGLASCESALRLRPPQARAVLPASVVSPHSAPAPLRLPSLFFLS